jgi:4-hydroxybenzoate polyprenyltransferase
MVDREDDLNVGIKSTAVLFGDADRLILGILQATIIAILLLVGQQAELGIFYYLGLLTMACLFIYHQFLARERDRAGCFKAFLHNNWAGFALFVGLAADRMLA